MEINVPISDKEIKKLLDFIFRDAENLYKKLAPKGWENSEYARFFHPTAWQQFEENKRITERLNSLTKKGKPEEYEGKEAYFEQDNLDGLNGFGEFLYVLGLSVYDIFSMNHEVKERGGAVYDLGSFRGSGWFMADYFNSYPDDRIPEKYGYHDFYMGSIWIESRADLLPFYTFIFNKLKDKVCTWEYYFPKLSIIDFKNNTGKTEEDRPEDYNPESGVARDLEVSKKNGKFKSFGMNLTRFTMKPLQRPSTNHWLKPYRHIKTSMAFCQMGTRKRSWSNQYFKASSHSPLPLTHFYIRPFKIIG